MSAVQQNGKALEYALNFRKDREIVLAAVQQDGLALQYVHKSLRKDQEIVLAIASSKRAELFQFADLNFQIKCILFF